MAEPDKLSFAERCHRYADQVISGEIVACELIKLACLRHVKDLASQGDADFPYVFNPLMRDSSGVEYYPAERICKLIELLPHVKGKWARDRQTILLGDWQVFGLASVFGWINRDTGLRRFKTAYEEVARKNAKTTKAAGVGLYMEVADDEAGAEVYSVANSADQARISWNIAKQMVEKSPGMQKRFGITPHAHAISVISTGSTFKYLSSDHKTLDGLSTSCAIVDEIHSHRTRETYDVVETSTGSREQPLMYGITTAGSNRAGVCYELRGYLIKILKGVAIDHTFFGVIYTLDSDEEWSNPECWIKANPNLGVSVSVEDLQRKFEKARTMPGAANNFKTKHCNIWVNADKEWMNMAAWDACGDPDNEIEQFVGQDCYLALDLMSRKDIAALTILFPWLDDDVQHFTFFNKFYLPEERIYTTPNDQYQGWLNTGILTGTPGNTIDYGKIEEDILEVRDNHNILEMPHDPYMAVQLAQNMMAEDILVVEMRPSALNFSEPMKELEVLVLDKRIHHDGNPCMAWMISNVVCHVDIKENIYPRKARDENKIDGPVSLIMALGRAIKGEIEQESVYETRGIVRL